ncbi:transcriptional repressor LexA [Gottschalkia acidurici 9a]|uniref:LexA repressor n=1 Tax=Gottschalkia acidurici (strain ATCC 7906 / DSM 604 / BCRC 14475 / CIP 104303 / KCTC 5404 / NCIMB 10678 / 9a) TaxID=1128398 RepID=K0AZ42_GOTA9|nr:transcriptional repressor LexA [Gottschalkia acidurici]AFS78534.1 transcriptional repressor LexA [Gottschalkia acidurici 9a]
MCDDLSFKQIEILEFIKKETRTKGYPPSVREICTAVDLKSTSSVHGHLEKIEKRGYIRRDPTKPRAIEILDKNTDLTLYAKKEVVDVPIVGSVTAGEPILAIENIEDTFPLPANFLKGANNPFMLRVKGESMINAGIFDGDFILVHQQNTADNGDIVIALLNQEATVKRFFKEKDFVRLQPENDQMAPILTKEVTILGKVIGLFRKL